MESIYFDRKIPNGEKEKVVKVNSHMLEATRIMQALRANGWTDTQIVDFCIYVESGNESYFQKIDKEQDK